MKKLITVILLFVCSHVMGAKYYFSQSSGDDTRTPAQAQNPATPWKSLTKFNSYFSSFANGDSVLFQRGDVFYGSVTAARSNLYVGYYGTGNAPIWTGLTLVSAWDAPVSNIYTSTAAASTLSTCQILVVNNANIAAGREPETGYWTIATTNGSTTITDGNISTSIVSANNGSQAVIRELMYEINRRTITNVSGNTITFTAGNPATGWGFFLQNDVKLCDNQNEWAYNTSTKKLAIYSASLPTSVYIPTIETGFDLQGYSNIKIEGINFRGYNSYGVNLNSAVRSQSNVTITNSQFNFIGSDGIYGYPNSGNLTVTSNTFSECNNKGVNAASSDAATISYNSFNNIGNIAGMGQNGDDSYTGIVANGDNSTVSFNSITNAGYCGIRGDGNSTVVTRNYVKNTTYIKDDGGAIYFFSVQAGNVPFPQTTRTVSYNTVIDFPGAPAGSGVSGYKPQGAGLYFDGQSANINVTGNVVGNTNSVTTGNYGIFQNGGRNINTNGNTVYNCRQAMYVTKVSNGGGSLNNTTIVNNIFCSPTTVTDCDTKNKAGEFLFDSTANPIAYNASNNVYANPLNTNSTIYGRYSSGQCYTLAQWQTATGVESGSTTSPTTVSDTTKILFLTNPTSGAVTTSLGVSCIDLRNNAYAGTITLQPYTGAILLKTGTSNTPPTCTAIPSATITLPVNSVSLNGVASSTTGGSISSWAWVKTSGPATGSVSNASSQVATAINLVQGTYVFTVTATDNNGLQCTSTKTVTVNAALVIPTANAGANQIITLPTSGVTLTGSGTDPDGTITGYAWVKLASSPATGTITAPTSASTTVTNLIIAGVYSFQLTVTDNNGATGKDTMTVTVLPAANIPPTANAGANQSITLPVNTATLTGSGTDTDGTITAYLWTILTGGAGSLTSTTTTTTSLINLVWGVYTVELMVTDNNGAVGRDTVQITVNAAIPVAPTATAGLDATITLPTNFAALNGTGKSNDGSTINSYLWTKLASSPATGTIVSNTSAVTSATNLVAGVYSFQLRVGSTNGLFGYDTVQITVNTAPSVPPLVNAGTDQIIGTPLTQCTLTGSAIAASGTISSYEWQKVSGTGGTITSPTLATTTVTGLSVGVYFFRLTATDSNGLSASDTVKVTVVAVLPINGFQWYNATLLPNQKVQLDWAVINEDVNYFDVRRSSNAIGKVNGIPLQYRYSFIDSFPKIGQNFYSLKGVDKDGSIFYSKTVAVTNSATYKINSVAINNNRVKMNITSTKTQQASVSFFDILNRVILVSNIILYVGANNYSRVTSYAKNIYYIVVSTKQESYTYIVK